MRAFFSGRVSVGMLTMAVVFGAAAMTTAQESTFLVPVSAQQSVTEDHPFGTLSGGVSLSDGAGPVNAANDNINTDPTTRVAVPVSNHYDEPSPAYGQPAGSSAAAVDRCRVFDGFPSCEPGYTADVELLAWKMLTSYEYAIQSDGTPQDLAPNINCGFRVGVGYRFYTCWDFGWRLTSFSTSDSESVTAPMGQSVTAANWGFGSAFPGIAASMSLHYLTNDIEIGRWFSLSDLDFFRQASNSLTMRLFGGFRWLDFSESISANSVGAAFPSYSTSNTQFGAYGGRFGTELRCLPTDHFSLFASGALSVMLSDGSSSTYQLISDSMGNQTIAESNNPHQISVVADFDLRTGLAYRNGPWELSGGYDFTVFNGALANVGGGSAAMALDGFFLRAAFTR